MNATLISVELRRNALAAASVLAAFLVTLPVARLVSNAAGLEPARSLEAILAAWVTVGLALAAALIGASAGAQTGSERSREIDAPLPASPRRRAASSLSAAALLLLAVAAPIGLAALAWDRLAVPSAAGSDPVWSFTGSIGYLERLTIVGLLEMLAASWLMAYLLGHGVGGGLLGALLAILCASGMMAGLMFEFWHSWREIAFHLLLPWLAALSIAGKLAAAAAAAPWLERRRLPSRAALAGAAGLVLLGPAAAWTGAYAMYLRAGAHRRDVGPVLATARGGAILPAPAGEEIVIPDGRAGFFDLMLRPYDEGYVSSATRGPDGTIWIQRSLRGSSELWRRKPDGTVSSRRMPGGRYYFLTREPEPRIATAEGASFRYHDAHEFFERGEKARALGARRRLERH